MEMNWIKIEDDIPDMEENENYHKLTKTVLVTDGKDIEMGYMESYDDIEDDDFSLDWYQVGRDGYKLDYMEITHWMPLPELP